MTTHIPYRSKFNKELLADNTGVGRSTLLAPARTLRVRRNSKSSQKKFLHSSKSDNNGQETQNRSRRKSCKTGDRRAVTYHYKGHTGNSGTDPIRNRYGRNSRRTALCPEIDTEKIPDETPSVPAAQEPRRRRTPPLSDYERMFLTPVEYGIRATLYVNASTKRKILDI